MARKLPVPYPRPIYHLLNCGDRCEPIFLDAKNRRLFLHTWSEAPEKPGCDIHAWRLLSNRFHLVTEADYRPAPSPINAPGFSFLRKCLRTLFPGMGEVWYKHGTSMVHGTLL
jgi:hypothetical protein